ncbi:Flavin reductase like domain [Teratosphaeria destructans]|uniref:Flavin reductase like domain n=1 Tax=Teratosphaeria destructans TaxID=418781 RepID=A0A9W7SX32_9PEZI|nr:Flavin reductase like domain [Teratosphaeria destructans]
MYRHDLARRRFYKAFYDWTLLTSPALASGHWTCSHVRRRRIASSAREWRAQSRDVIAERQGSSSQDAAPPIQFYHVRSKSTSHWPISWLSDPVLSSSEKPSDSLQAWEEVIRYRSRDTILLEFALPVGMLAQLSTGRKGMDLRELASESGATVELGAIYRTEGGGEQLRSVAVSGMFEEVQKVAKVFHHHKTIKVLQSRRNNHEVKAGMQSSQHRLSGIANVATVPVSTTSSGGNREAELGGATISTAAMAVPGQLKPRLSRQAARRSMKTAWLLIAPIRDENNLSAQKLSCELPIPTPVLHLIQKQHGEGLQGLMAKYAQYNVHIQLGDAEYVGECRDSQGQLWEMLLSSVIVTASELTNCKRVTDHMQSTYRRYTKAVFGRNGEEAQAEIAKMILKKEQPWRSLLDRPVVSEEQMQSKDIEVGTFVVRQRPGHQPSEYPDSSEDYFAAAERQPDTWIVEIVLPQVQWDFIDHRKHSGVQAKAQSLGIEIEIAEEGFEAPILGSSQGKAVLARPAKLVGPLQRVYEGIHFLLSAQPTNEAPAKIVKSDIRSVQPVKGASESVKALNQAHEPANVNTQSGSADQNAVKTSKVPFEPSPASVQLARTARDASTESAAPSKPGNVTTRLQVAGSFRPERVLRGLAYVACTVTPIGAEGDGLFELTGTPCNIRKALSITRHNFGSSRVSINNELAVIQAAEEEMQEDMKTALRPLTHPVVIITSRMAMKPSSDEPQPQEPIDQYRGVTVSSFNTVTLGNPGPPIVSFNLKVPSRTWAALVGSTNMCVNILSATPSAAAIAQLFTKQYEEPSEPFKLLCKAGGLVSPTNPRNPKSPPQILMAGVVLARMKAKLMMEKCIQVADHVVALAQVNDLEFAPEIPKGTSDGSFATSKLSRPEARRRVEEAMGLAYAKRGYRSLGKEIDPEAPVVGPWSKDESLAMGASVSVGGMERADAEDASMSSSKELDDAPRNNITTAQDQTGALGMPDLQGTEEPGKPRKLPDPRTPSTAMSSTVPPSTATSTTATPSAAQSANEPITSERDMMEALTKTRRKAAQDEEDDYDLGFTKKTNGWPPKLIQELDSALGDAGSGYTPGRRNEALLPHGTRAFSTMAGRRSYSTTPARPVDEERPEHNERHSKPVDCVTDPSLLTQSINEFLGLPPTSTREVPPMRALLKAQEAAVQASRKLQDALSDGSLTPQQSLALETEIATNERRVAKQLALRANHDLKKMLDTGKVDFRRVGWLEQTVEKGLVVVVEEARLLRGIFDKGEIGEVVFEKAKKKLEARHAELNEGAMRLRGMVEDEDDGF